jgi:large subunit ribosomal protein L16
MLQPKRVKFRRPHRVSYEGHVKGKNTIVNGEYALVALEGAWITSRQIEAARIAITRHMKRLGQLWINIFPHLSISRKPAEVRMGSGKGAPDHWVAVVKIGKVMFELNGVSEEIAREALRLAIHKLPIKCKIVTKEAWNNEVNK